MWQTESEGSTQLNRSPPLNTILSYFLAPLIETWLSENRAWIFSADDTEVIQRIRYHRISWASGRHSSFGFWTFRVQIPALCRTLLFFSVHPADLGIVPKWGHGCLFLSFPIHCALLINRLTIRGVPIRLPSSKPLWLTCWTHFPSTQPLSASYVLMWFRCRLNSSNESTYIRRGLMCCWTEYLPKV